MASEACESSCARPGWTSLKNTFHSRGIRRACRPCVSSCGSSECSCLWHPFHTFYTDVPCDNVHPTVCICCSMFHRSCIFIENVWLQMNFISVNFKALSTFCGLSTQTTVLWFVLCVYPWDWQNRMRCRNHLHSRCRHWVRCSRVVSSECTRILCRQRLFHTCCTSMTCPPYDFPYGLPDIF